MAEFSGTPSGAHRRFAVVASRFNHQIVERLGFAPDLRNYGIGAQILLDLGLKSIRPITNNPRKMVGLEGYGLRVDERVSIVQPANTENSGYMGTKRDKLGHLLAS